MCTSLLICDIHLNYYNCEISSWHNVAIWPSSATTHWTLTLKTTLNKPNVALLRGQEFCESFNFYIPNKQLNYDLFSLGEARAIYDICS